MKRLMQGVLVGFGLACTLVLTGIPGVFPNVLERRDQQRNMAWQAARLLVLRDAALLSCIEESDLRRAIELRGWEVQPVDPQTETIPDRLSAAQQVLRVFTQPAKAKTGDLEGFDSRGCLMR